MRPLFFILLSFLLCVQIRAQVVESEADKTVYDNDNNDSLLLLTQEQADSLEFRLSHHYTENFNFRVKKDSVMLVSRDDELSDTCFVMEDDIIAVAQIKNLGDTVWVKVARDQLTMGWLNEKDLLQSAVPDDEVSRIIDWLTGTRAIWMSVFVLFGVVGFLLRQRLQHRMIIFKFNEMDSLYPYLMLSLVALIAIIYTGIQNFAPEFWQEYYFHPTLNPLVLPGIMSVLISLMWLLLIVIIALLLDVYHNFYFLPGLKYLLEISGVAMSVYLTISLTAAMHLWYLSLLLSIVYVIAFVYIYIKYVRCSYICGACGAKLSKKGICPYCGKNNK
ncbi:MAG: hypothetical protein J5805_02280 [Bacteroidaceae bacterium]|nr:hypothetical protein [Bacteroidaceae bacterium]